MLKWMRGFALYAGLFLSLPDARADLYVPSGFPTIQSAINAASPGDIIHLAPGMYPEILTVAKSLSIVGSGTNNCVIYSCPTNYVPLIGINGPATVALSGFTLVGGIYMGAALNYYNGFSPLGITSTNATLTMNSVVINQIQNFFVTVVGGSLLATNVALWTQDVLMGCDVGFQLNSCVAIINGLTQDAGHIDHTININNPPATFSDVTIANCRIRASRLTYGNCIRTYVNSRVIVTNCFLYRATGSTESPVTYPALDHDAVSVNAYSNTVTIIGNTISNLPCAIYCYGSLGGNEVVIENNSIIDSIFNGIAFDAMNYKGVDLGGGALGSDGGNVFTQVPAASTNYCDDVLYTNLNGASPANILALNNTWSNPTNKSAVIYDHLHNPVYGRLITDALTLAASASTPGGKPALTWNERGAGEQYTVETRSDLTTGAWIAAPGTWPVTNPTFNAMRWTNPAPVASTIFYRLRSTVP
jgi:hypothetical protein